ncbi:peroxisomal membrane protein PEX13 [Episyrphus balteatus]|uniref:peroxisomal membrane protein PEX13 n=1 Tax=Episyrphus balteatus TaxID=286459 RepID=UPI002486B1E8|nr:peroxisomal membrane protein PEX13 [Episyrphus balteatus]
MSENGENFRSAILNEPIITSGTGVTTSGGVMRTPFGNVRALGPQLPPSIPPPPMRPSYGGQTGGYLQQNSFGYMSNPFMASGGGYGGYGGGFNAFGGGGYGGATGFGGYNGAYGRFGMNSADPEQRFIQLAENSSRPAFQSIESLVSAIGNIAQMLDSTFFALTSSFRAILGVAANFGRLRTVFAQFWQTFAIFRGLNWIYRKILYWLRISNLDPSSMAFKEAFAAAMKQSSTAKPGPALPNRGASPWPVLAFISFIFTAPYLIMKLIGTVSETALEETRNPEKWVNPIEATASYDFEARNPSELSFQAGQRIVVAPKEIQNTHHLLSTGWGLATIDGQSSGLIPINYLKTPSQMRQPIPSTIPTDNSIPSAILDPHPQLPGLGVNDFAIAPQMISGVIANPSLTDQEITPLVN